MIGPRAAGGQGLLAAVREVDPVVAGYRALFAVLDWEQVPERDPTRPWPGPLPHPRAAYLKAFLVRICEGAASAPGLRAFLVKHPPLVIELGFRPVPAPSAPYGFDVEATVPGARWLRHQLRALDDAWLRALLEGTVRALRAEVPGLGETVAYDVKHLYAWVKENNPKAFVAHRFAPERQPTGDPDCRLGVKRRGNQVGPRGEAAGPAECLWGYGSGVASALCPPYGDVVVAEHTQPFSANDVTYFRPLHERATAALGRPPTNLAADAAFDAWYVYAACVLTGGLAAVPLNTRGNKPPDRDAHGVPRCARGLSMAPRAHFAHADGYPAVRYACPLLHPHPSDQSCADPRFPKGGCTRVVNLSAGGQARLALDRASDAYRAVYRQRTCAERINSQAKDLGIERPKVRNARSVAHLNSLTYLVINARALQRGRQINAKEAHAA